MKVKMQEGYKGMYTLDEVKMAKAVIASEKEDEETAAGYGAMAVREALKGTEDRLDAVISASAETIKNWHAWNAYGDTGHMDIWIEATAKTTFGFIVVGVCLTDIWQSGAVDYRESLFVRYYREAKLS